MTRVGLFALLTLFGVVWGITIPLSKIAVSTGHHPLGLITVQLAITSAVTGLLMLWRGTRFALDVRLLPFFAVVAVTGTLVPNSFSYIVAFHLPGGVLALIIALVPIFTFLIASLFRIEPFAGRRFGGVLLGAAAIALLVLPDSSLPDPAKVPFILIGLIAPLCYGIEGNYLAVRQPSEIGPIATLFGSSFLGLLIVFPVALASGTLLRFDTGPGAPEFALVVSSVLHVIAYSGYIWLVKIAGSVFSAQVSYIVTPAGVVLSIFFLGENPSTYIWLALITLMIGLALVQPRSSTDR